MTASGSIDELRVGIVLLIDSDPPSSHGEIGLYAPESGGGPPDPDVFRRRHEAVVSFLEETAVPAAVTVHTSQRYRSDMLEQPFLPAWHELTEMGADLVLHPHEERADGTPRYDELDHIAGVIHDSCGAAAAVGIHFSAFRSGFFAFNEALPAALATHGITVDLSCASGLTVPERGVQWPVGIDNAYVLGSDPEVLEVPLGWSGHGTDLDHDYLFNERQDLAGLKRVFEAIRARAESDGQPRLVNLLCHGHGLVRSAYREQLRQFIGYLRTRNAELLSIEAAIDFYNRQAQLNSSTSP